MATNKYFRNYSYAREQDTAEDLIIESIKMHGLDVKYLPLTLVNQDFLLGEDRIATFNKAVDVEVYLKDVQGFQGEGDFLSKFNLEIRDSVTLTIARKRWNQISTEKLIEEVGYNYQVETADTNNYANTESYLLESGTANGYSITSSRPLEGDAIFFPFTNKIYKIKFVEHESIFYQHGKLYTYDLQCELMDRDWVMQTGNTQIDTISTSLSLDILMYQLKTEDGFNILNEDDGFMLNEFRIETSASMANNEIITQESFEFVNWSESSPFSETDRW